MRMAPMSVICGNKKRPEGGRFRPLRRGYRLLQHYAGRGRGRLQSAGGIRALNIFCTSSSVLREKPASVSILQERTTTTTIAGGFLKNNHGEAQHVRHGEARHKLQFLFLKYCCQDSLFSRWKSPVCVCRGIFFALKGVGGCPLTTRLPGLARRITSACP